MADLNLTYREENYVEKKAALDKEGEELARLRKEKNKRLEEEIRAKTRELEQIKFEKNEHEKAIGELQQRLTEAEQDKSKFHCSNKSLEFIVNFGFNTQLTPLI
jgi:hypothetical protein